MKICMILHDPQEFGGLEEYAVTLAIGLKQSGQQVSILSTTWVSRNNQYVRRLLANDVAYVQVPKWLSRPASHWPTKEKILRFVIWLAIPLIFLMAVGLLPIKRSGWRRAWSSAHGWLNGQIQARFIAPNRYKTLTIMLLNWWQLRWRPELFHIQGYTSSLLFAIDWAYKKKIPVVYEEHQTPDAQFNWWQGFDQSINKSTRVVAVSEKSADALRKVCGVTRPILVRNPLLPDPQASGWNARNGRYNHHHGLQVTTIARLTVAKGLTYLLDVAALIKRSHPEVEFTVFGEGELRDELMAKAAGLGLDGEKIFQGAFTHREDLDKIMAQTDIFVLSSILEGQPLSVVEAMAYGRPIVATTVGGIPELIRDGSNGLLCPPRDPQRLAEKIRVLIEDPCMRERLGKAARDSYEGGEFQPASVSNHFISIYQDVLQEGIPG